MILPHILHNINDYFVYKYNVTINELDNDGIYNILYIDTFNIYCDCKKTNKLCN